MDEKQMTLTKLDTFADETAGQDMLRYIGLPALLGHEKDSLLYFMGRQLARNIEYDSLEDVYYIFQKLRWGNLELIKEKRQQIILHLMSDDIVRRLSSPIETEFRLESGFIAESFQKITQRKAECFETINQRLYRVEFKVFFTD